MNHPIHVQSMPDAGQSHHKPCAMQEARKSYSGSGLLRLGSHAAAMSCLHELH